MPTPVPAAGQVVTVCFGPGEDADWFAAAERVSDLLRANGTPARRYHVRHRPMIGWLTRFFGYYLLDAARTCGAVTLAAGGRKSRLDLDRTAARAGSDAALRWRGWYIHIAATTPAARPWEDYLAQHHTDPAKVSLAEARRRFELQPRVLAMLAYAGGDIFDPYELSLYQAGEATYTGLHWRLALIGDVLITIDGRVLKPADDTFADRFRFLNQASGYLRRLPTRAHLCAVAIG